MSSEQISFYPCDTRSLCDETISQIYRIEQDMWAREQGLGEYLSCDSCSEIFSKQDIYKGVVDGKRYVSTVYELEQEESRDIFSCRHCSGKLRHIFSQESYIASIRDRYSSRATLLLMQRGEELIGFMDGYVDSFDTIYDREFSDHYSQLGVRQVKKMVRHALQGEMPQEFFSCSSSGTLERYMNMIHIYNLLQKFFENFPEDMLGVTALSELHAGGPYTKMFSKLGARSIGIREKYGDKIQTTDTYSSDIYVHESFGQKCQKAFSGVSRKEFLEKIRL